MLIFPALWHFYFAKYRSFHIVFNTFSSKLVAVSTPIIFHRLDIIYFLLLTMNKFLCLSGYLFRLLPHQNERNITMSNQHKNPTISFRIPDAERKQIEARILASGMMKKITLSVPASTTTSVLLARKKPYIPGANCECILSTIT